jgi:hypothetical protein
MMKMCGKSEFSTFLYTFVSTIYFSDVPRVTIFQSISFYYCMLFALSTTLFSFALSMTSLATMYLNIDEKFMGFCLAKTYRTKSTFKKSNDPHFLCVCTVSHFAGHDLESIQIRNGEDSL